MERFPCLGCEADLVYDPETRGLRCPYCGRTEPVPLSAVPLGRHDLETFLTPDAAALARLADDALEVTCSGCGATTAFTPPEVAGLCPFCGAKIVAQPVAESPLIAPQGILPFTVTKRVAASAIRQWTKSRWLAPNALKELAAQESISGVYLPYWTFDAHSAAHYQGERGDWYFVTEKFWQHENGVLRQREKRVRKTRWRYVQGRLHHRFTDILVPATCSIAKRWLDALAPWDLTSLRPYAPAFLSGFRAQRYQVGLESGYESACDEMTETLRARASAEIGGDEQRLYRLETQFTEGQFQHLLLPVWIGTYRYNGRVYQVVVNGRTGAVHGERPYSVWKIVGLILLAVVLVAVILSQSHSETALHLLI